MAASSLNSAPRISRAVRSCKRRFGYDDSLDVFGVHGAGGIIGALGTTVFMAPGLGGVGFADGIGMLGQLARQAIGVGVTLLWTGGISLLRYQLVSAITGGLRVSADNERQSLDETLHGERAYS